MYSSGPSKVFRGNGNIKNSSMSLYNGKTLGIQPLPEPEVVIAESDLVIFLQQWFPSKFEVGPKIEMVVSENMTLTEFKQFLSTKYGITNVGISKPSGSFPGPDILEIPEADWDRKIPEYSYSYSSIRMGALGSAPLYVHDGDIVLFRDNDELLKELTKEEKRKFEKEAQARKSRSGYHHKEEALTINAKV